MIFIVLLCRANVRRRRSAGETRSEPSVVPIPQDHTISIRTAASQENSVCVRVKKILPLSLNKAISEDKYTLQLVILPVSSYGKVWKTFCSIYPRFEKIEIHARSKTISQSSIN